MEESSSGRLVLDHSSVGESSSAFQTHGLSDEPHWSWPCLSSRIGYIVNIDKVLSKSPSLSGLKPEYNPPSVAYILCTELIAPSLDYPPNREQTAKNENASLYSGVFVFSKLEQFNNSEIYHNKGI
jgi:hypothetical protein